MGDISPETRRLIDEAVADGRVTVIPQGVTSHSEEMRWNGATNKLEFVDKEAARQRAKGSTAGIWGKRRGPAPDPKVAARRAKIADLIQSGKAGPEIASLVGVPTSTVYRDAKKLGMSIARASRSPAQGIVAPARSKHDPLVEERRKQVADAFDGMRSATDIADLTGINKRTVVDHLKALGLKAPAGKPGPGANSPRAIATAARREKVKALAAEGKNGPELMARVEQEIADLCAQHERVLVRLHVLGDFWSVEYVDLWARLLERFGGLHVFGFTAHKQGGEIGDYIAAIRNLHPRRFWIRHSDMTGPWGSFTVDFPTQQKTIGDAVVCPEQRDGMSGERKGTHCGNCAVCWSSSVPVAFVTH